MTDRERPLTSRGRAPSVEVSGGPGALLVDGQQRLIGVVALDIAGGQITSISAIVNPDSRHTSGRSPTSDRS
jgi:hypothetical protein